MRVSVIVPAKETQEGGTTAAAASPTKGTHLPPPPVPPRAPRRVTLPPPPPLAPPKAPTATTSPQKSTQEGGTTTTASPLSGPIWILYYVQEVGIWKNVFLMLKRCEIYFKTKSKVLRGLRKSSVWIKWAFCNVYVVKSERLDGLSECEKTDSHCVQKTLQVFKNFVI